MPITPSDLKTVFADTAGLITSVIEQASAMEALLGKAEAARTKRSEEKPIEVLEVRAVDGRIIGKIQGVEAVYHPRITVSPRRAFSCDCPDSKHRGRRVGPCKHTQALARHWMTHLQPELDRMHAALVGILF